MKEPTYVVVQHELVPHLAVLDPHTGITRTLATVYEGEQFAKWAVKALNAYKGLEKE